MFKTVKNLLTGGVFPPSPHTLNFLHSTLFASKAKPNAFLKYKTKTGFMVPHSMNKCVKSSLPGFGTPFLTQKTHLWSITTFLYLAAVRAPTDTELLKN